MMMALASPNVAITTIEGATLGRTCRTMIRTDEAPMHLADSMYSFSRIDRDSPRTTRAYGTQLARAITRITFRTLVPRPPMMAMASKMYGKASWMSTSRIRILSAQPP